MIEDILKLIKNNSLEIKVKANSNKQNVFLKNGEVYVEVKEPAEENKANLAIIKLFQKLTGKKVRIVRGITSKNKVLRFSD